MLFGPLELEADFVADQGALASASLPQQLPRIKQTSRKTSQFCAKHLILLARPKRFELLTPRFVV